MKWKWKEVEEDRPYCETWVCGEPILGCGVYKAGEEWTGCVVIFNESYKVPVRHTKEEAMVEAESRFQRMYDIYHENVD